MVAYSCEKRHHGNILSGAKPFTLRKTGKKRHARVGETLQLRDGRTGPVFATAQCVFRAKITFDESGLTRVSEATWIGDGDKIARLFAAAEQASYQAEEHREKLAVQDGFADWATMVAWHAEQDGLKGGCAPGETIEREVIGFAATRSTAAPAPTLPAYRPDVCIYHDNCTDGFTAAWAVWKRWPDCLFVAGQYGDPAPQITSGEHVLIVDFSYKRPALEALGRDAASITILDHHKSAQAELEVFTGAGLDNIRAEFDMNRSGAMMAWQFAHPDTSAPQLVEVVQDRDLWRFALDDTRTFSAAISSYDHDFEIWDDLAERFNSPRGVDRLAREGQAILRRERKDVDEICDLTLRWMVIGGFRVPVANAPKILSSEVAGQLAEGNPFAAAYYDRDDGRRQFSLRSRGEIYGKDVSLIAAAYGGGGHAGAAGFTAPQGWEGDGAPESIRDLVEAAGRVAKTIADIPPSVGEDDHEIVEVLLAELKGLRRASRPWPQRSEGIA
jgi:hypothetical protein